MKIDRLNQETILVTMAAQDMRDYALDFENDTKPEQLHSGLRRLLYLVGETCAFSPRGKRFSVEALPAREGCLLVICVHPARRRIYRIKGGRVRLYVFVGADDLLDWLLLKEDLRYTLYRYRSRYVLIPAQPAQKAQSVLRRLTEYAVPLPADRITAARVREYGELIQPSTDRRS